MKCENQTEDMIDILQHVQKYVPVNEDDGSFKPILFGGDQLTRERAMHAQRAKAQSRNALRKLQGLLPKSEDWHALVCFYEVNYN